VPTDEDLQNVRSAYEEAWAQAKARGDEALDALQKADALSPGSAQELFKRRAASALEASENWSTAAKSLLARWTN